MKTSETIADLAAALAVAQGELSNTTKDQKANAGKVKYTYANIASVLDDVRPVLAKHGLAVVQGADSTPGEGYDSTDRYGNPTRVEPREVCVTTRIIHTSGQWMQTSLSVPLDDMGGIRGVGSAITYARRYGLQSMLGIASDDDDGAAAQAQPRRAGPPEWVGRARAHAESQGVAWDDVLREMGEPPERWRDGQKVRAVIEALAGEVTA